MLKLKTTIDTNFTSAWVSLSFKKFARLAGQLFFLGVAAGSADEAKGCWRESWVGARGGPQGWGGVSRTARHSECC